MSGRVMVRSFRVSVNMLTAVYLIGLAIGFGTSFLQPVRDGWPALLRELGPLLLTPVPLLLAVALLVRARVALVILLAPLLAIAVLYGSQFLPKDQVPISGPGFRILSYNVGAARHRYQPAEVLTTILLERPDIVCLVEAPPDTLSTLGLNLRATYEYQVGSSSVFVLSRFPLTESQAAVVADGVKDSLHVTVEVDHRLVRLIAVHLQRIDAYPGIRGGPTPMFRAVRRFSTDARDTAMEDIVALLRDEHGPQILAGDLNMTPTSQAHSVLTAELQDAFQEAGSGLGHTYPATLRSFGLDLSVPLIRIDYIFHTPDLVAQRAWNSLGRGSDHLPIIADLAFR
ncbi:MAG: endonuclease/exonuclease/phosphatase family protein [Chloroflexota bacterium]